MIKTIMYILILSIVLISAIYFYHSYSKTKKNVEGFSEVTVDAVSRKTIMDSFNAVLGRDPYEYEVKVYASEMSHPYDKDIIENKIKGSSEYKKNMAKESLKENKLVNYDFIEGFQQDIEANKETVKSFIEKMSFDDKLESYRIIVKQFENNLDRLPTVEELNYFTYKLKQDNFDLTKMEQVLQSSKEFSILTNNQTNLVNARIVENITERQMELMVKKAYQEVFDKELTEDYMIKFLITKLHDYSLNTDKLKAFLKLMYDFDMNKLAQQQTSTTQQQETSSQKEAAKQAAETSKADVQKQEAANQTQKAASQQEKPTVTEEQASDGKTSTNESGKTSTNESAKASKEDDDASKQFFFCSPLLNDSKCMSKNAYKKFAPFFDSVYEANSDFQKSNQNCTYDYMNTEKDQKLANEQMKRHQDYLGMKCNTSLEQVLAEQLDGFGAPFDSGVNIQYRNTKYGAYIGDAEDTKVGSILPKFVFKELAN
jgi:hypothetical protein